MDVTVPSGIGGSAVALWAMAVKGAACGGDGGRRDDEWKPRVVTNTPTRGRFRSFYPGCRGVWIGYE